MVDKCWRRMSEKSVGEEACSEVLYRTVGEESCREVL